MRIGARAAASELPQQLQAPASDSTTFAPQRGQRNVLGPDVARGFTPPASTARVGGLQRTWKKTT